MLGDLSAIHLERTYAVVQSDHALLSRAEGAKQGCNELTMLEVIVRGGARF
jgi:hypothetical protein